MSGTHVKVGPADIYDQAFVGDGTVLGEDLAELVDRDARWNADRAWKAGVPGLGCGEGLRHSGGASGDGLGVDEA